MVAELILGLRDAGPRNGVPLHIGADLLPELRARIQLFARKVMPLVSAG